MRPPNLRTDGAFSLLLLLLLLLFDLTFHTGRRERPFSLVNSTTRRSDAINVGGPPARLLSFLFINYISLFLLLLSFAPRRIYSNRMMEREILYISTCSIVSIADCCCCCCWLSLDDKRNLQGPFPSAAGLDAPKVANHDILLCVCVCGIYYKRRRRRSGQSLVRNIRCSRRRRLRFIVPSEGEIVCAFFFPSPVRRAVPERHDHVIFLSEQESKKNSK